MRITTALLVMVAAMPTVARAEKPRASDPLTVALGGLRTAAACDDPRSPWRSWCIAADWDAGKPGELPQRPLIGLTIELETGVDPTKALRERVSLATFTVIKDQVKLTEITPTEKGDDLLIGEAVGSVAAVFKGKAKTAKIPTDLATHIRSRPATYKISHEPTEWMWRGATPSRLRKVGKFWVIIETADGGTRKGYFATILTDAWE